MWYKISLAGAGLLGATLGYVLTAAHGLAGLALTLPVAFLMGSGAGWWGLLLDERAERRY